MFVLPQRVLSLMIEKLQGSFVMDTIRKMNTIKYACDFEVTELQTLS